MKPVAVLSSNLETTIEWLKGFGECEVKLAERKVIFNKSKRVYVIIQNIEQAYAWEFSTYICAPDYFTLEDVVKTRIK